MGAKANDRNVKGSKGKEEKSKSLSKLIAWIWLGLSQGLRLPITALRRLNEGLTEWFAERQINKTACLKHRVNPPATLLLVFSGKHKKSILRAQGSRSCTEDKPTQRKA